MEFYRFQLTAVDQKGMLFEIPLSWSLLNFSHRILHGFFTPSVICSLCLEIRANLVCFAKSKLNMPETSMNMVYQENKAENNLGSHKTLFFLVLHHMHLPCLKHISKLGINKDI